MMISYYLVKIKKVIVNIYDFQSAYIYYSPTKCRLNDSKIKSPTWVASSKPFLLDKLIFNPFIIGVP